MKIVGVIFETMKILNFFLMLTTLNFEDRSKTKKTRWRYLREISRYHIERDESVGLCALLGEVTQKIKINFLASEIFPGKADSVILLGFECTINTKFNQNRCSHF